MDLIKVILFLAIGGIAYYLLLQWPPGQDSRVVVPQEQKEIVNKELNKISNSEVSKDLLTPLEEQQEFGFKDQSESLFNDNTAETFYIENDVLKIGVDSKTGRFLSSELNDIQSKKEGKSPLSILGNRPLSGESSCRTDEGALKGENACFGNYYASSGFFSEERGYINPNFKSIEKTTLTGDKSLYVLVGENKNFSFVRKILVSPRKYSLLVEDIVGLKSSLSSPEKLVPYIEIVRDSLETGLDGSRFAAYSYVGPVFSTEDDSFRKVQFSDLADESFQEISLGGWFAIIQRYFMSAWIPEQGKTYKFQARKTSKNNYSVALTGEEGLVDTNSPLSFKNQMYVGPKISEELNELDPNLGLVVDYGFLWWLGQPMYWLLGLGFKLLGNWGFAIIFATIVIRAVLWPLTAYSYKSMAKLRALTPEIQSLQAKHGSDKAKLAQETMAFYKKEGVNPLGGCLPMILQMPFFIAFYWVLLDMVQLRHAPFIFWIKDLSSSDPYFVLPLVNGALMYLSQKFMPVTPSTDPTQQQMQQMMKYMPVGICLIFIWFPSGFVLYFVAQTFVQLFQQALNFKKEGVSLKSVILK